MVSVTLGGHRMLWSVNLGTISNVSASPADVSKLTRVPGNDAVPMSMRMPEAPTMGAAMTKSKFQPLPLAVSGAVANVGSDGPTSRASQMVIVFAESQLNPSI